MGVSGVNLVQQNGYLFLYQPENTNLTELAIYMIHEAQIHNSTVCAMYKDFELMAFPDNTPEYIVGFYRGYMHRSNGNHRSMRYSKKR